MFLLSSEGESLPLGGTTDGLQEVEWEQGTAVGTKAEAEGGKGQQDPVRGESDRLTAADTNVRRG